MRNDMAYSHHVGEIHNHLSLGLCIAVTQADDTEMAPRANVSLHGGW